MRQLLSIFSHSKAARSICVSEPVNFLERLDDELVVDIMGRMTVKQIVRLRVAGTWGKQLIEGSSFSGIWKTAFRIVFTTQYLAIPLDDNRNWYQEFMQVVEQNPNRARLAASAIPGYMNFGRKDNSILIRSAALTYWTLPCFDGDSVIDLKKRIALNLNVPVAEQTLNTKVAVFDDIGDMQVEDRMLQDTMQVTLSLIGEQGMVWLQSRTAPRLSMLSPSQSEAGDEEQEQGEDEMDRACRAMERACREEAAWHVQLAECIANLCRRVIGGIAFPKMRARVTLGSGNQGSEHGSTAPGKAIRVQRAVGPLQ